MLTVPINTSVQDTANLQGSVSGGSIAFSLYGPVRYGGSILSEITAIYTSTVAVTGPGTYTSGSYLITCPGEYYWVATYTAPSGGGVGTLYGDTSEVVMAYTPDCQPILAADNGYVVKRIAQDDYCVVWAGVDGVTFTARGDPINFGSGPPINTSSRIGTARNFGNVEDIIYSTTGGDVWTNTRSTVRPTGFNTSPDIIGKDGRYTWNVTEDGTIWVARQQSVSPFNYYIYTSSDLGQNFTTQVFNATAAFGANPVSGVFISDTYIWYLRNATDVLWRADLTGANIQSYVATTGNWTALNGYPGTDRLVAWAWRSTTPVLSIDITNPSSPTFAMSTIDANSQVYDVVPLSNQILIAHTLSNASVLQGGIWRSVNGGSTWTQVVANTTNLGNAALTGFDNDINSIAINGDEVWVAMKVPYVYHSVDQGANWTLETVSTGIFSASGIPTRWTGILVGCAAPVPPTARRIPFVTLIGAN